MRIVTIGGYGFTESTFVGALQRARIDTFLDIRQRRGMRGAKYAFLNSLRLQSILVAAGIKYVHAHCLAPTTDVRDAQRADDRTSGLTKRERTQLSPSFVMKYRSEILEPLDVAWLQRELVDASAIALFCVEGDPSACHRSLAAGHLVVILDADGPVEHLTQ